jgi:hypothetical protein
MSRVVVACVGVVVLILGLVVPAQAETVEVIRDRGLIARAAASYDGAHLTAEVDVRRGSHKVVDLYAVVVDTGNAGGAERTVYVSKRAAEIEDEDLRLVPCDGLVADFAPRSLSVEIPATCLGDDTPDRVRAQWRVWWHRRVDGDRLCGVQRVPSRGFSEWVDAATRRGC